MKTKILSLLLDNKDEFISGELISKQLGVSRTAIWKNIDQLRNQGYNIVSQTKKGYKLINEPDVLSESNIKVALGDFPFLKEVLYFRSIDSTNTKAKILAEQGADEATVLIAEEQTAGRGRLGRVWDSSKSNGLFFSLVLRPNVVPSQASVLTQVAAVAMAKAINTAVGVSVGIKWPNDLWIGNKKLCGILTEMSAEFSRVNYVVIGIGVNVNNNIFDGELFKIATSLKIETGKDVKRVDILVEFLKQFLYYYNKFKIGGNWSEALEFCRSNSITIGRDVNVLKYNETIPARAMDILESGELLVKLEDGTSYAVNSGEVSIRNR